MDCDVVIVGCGPAGSAASFFLASRNISTICIERLPDARFERYHSICGECISVKGSKTAGITPDEIRNRIKEFRLDWPGGRSSRIKIDGLIIDRVKVLQRLRRDAEEKGAHFITSSVVEVKKIPRGFETILGNGESIQSRYIIGADGAFSIVRKYLFESRPEKILPVEMRVLNSPPELPETIRFTLKDKGGYYGWDFPYGTGRSVGAVRGYLEETEGFHGARYIPIGWPDTFVKDGAALIGDAAGMVNPVSFGGLRIAFESAKHSAEAIASGDLQRYEKWWRKSPLSDRRYMRLSELFASYDAAQYEFFSRHLGGGFWSGGIVSVLTRPRLAWAYFGCLMAIKNGW